MIDRDPAQPREEFDEEALGRLAESLKAAGPAPADPRPLGRGQGGLRDRLSASGAGGPRSWRASRPSTCVIVEGAIDPDELLAIQLVENCPARGPQADRAGPGLQTLMERERVVEPPARRGAAVVQATSSGCWRSWNCPRRSSERVEQGGLAPATAYEIGKLEDPAEQQALADRVEAEGLTRQEAVAAVRDRKQGGDTRGITPGRGRGGLVGIPGLPARDGHRPLPGRRHALGRPGIRAALKQVQAQDADQRTAEAV